MGTTSVRRNLFHHNLSSRPVSAAPPNPLGQGGNTESRIQHNAVKSSSSDSAASTLTTGQIDNGEIVVKDKNGGYELDIPVLAPVLGSEDGDEMDGLEEAGVSSGPATADSGEPEISGHEKEKIEASLMEMMCRNRNRQLSSEPNEILSLIQQSLRNKVASLEEDNWMYEPENEPRP